MFAFIICSGESFSFFIDMVSHLIIEKTLIVLVLFFTSMNVNKVDKEKSGLILCEFKFEALLTQRTFRMLGKWCHC